MRSLQRFFISRSKACWNAHLMNVIEHFHMMLEQAARNHPLERNVQVSSPLARYLSLVVSLPSTCTSCRLRLNNTEQQSIINRCSSEDTSHSVLYTPIIMIVGDLSRWLLSLSPIRYSCKGWFKYMLPSIYWKWDEPRAARAQLDILQSWHGVVGYKTITSNWITPNVGEYITTTQQLWKNM